MNIIKQYRFLISRRILQFLILILFIGGNYFGWTILKGNLSSALLFETIHLSDPFAVLQIFAAGFLASANVIIGAVTMLLLYAILGGRSFCAWVCPVNWLTDLARWIGTKLKMNSKTGVSFPKYYRYWILVLSFILSTILGFAAFEMISPIGILQRSIIFGAGSGLFILAGIFFLEMAVLKNGWCGHLCPLGAFYSIIGKYGIFRVYHKVENCTECMDCFKVCPEPQVLSIINKESGLINFGNCTNCGRCVEVCLDDALKLSHRFGKKQ